MMNSFLPPYRINKLNGISFQEYNTLEINIAIFLRFVGCSRGT